MLSVCILTKNSEKDLPRALASVSSLADEIIIIDDFSDDTTVQIAKKSGARVYLRHLEYDFAEQRNFALQKAKGDWILFLDSDEEIPPTLQFEIRSCLTNPEISGVQIKRKDIFLGKVLEYGETGNIRFLRLARQNRGMWERKVHEVWNVKGVIIQTHSWMNHYPHTTVREFLDEINTYSTIQAEMFLSEGKHVSLWHIVFYPAGKFLVNYYWKLGFLDGSQGMIMALCMSYHSFLTRAKLWEKSIR